MSDVIMRVSGMILTYDEEMDETYVVNPRVALELQETEFYAAGAAFTLGCEEDLERHRDAKKKYKS